MTCIYEDNMDGECFLYEDGCVGLGVNEDGDCIVCDDPDPSYSCDSYESDNVCDECGYDLNTEDCACGE